MRHGSQSGRSVAAARDLAAEHPLSPQERAFIHASVRAQEAEAQAERARVRRLHRLTAALTALTVLIAGVAGFALRQNSLARTQRAKAQRETARSNAAALAAAATDARTQGRPETADLLAAHAHRLDPGGVQARSAVLSTQGELLAGRLAPRPHAPRRLAQTLSPDGQTLATYDAAEQVQLWDLRSRTLHRELATGPGKIYRQAISVSADGRTVAVGKRQGRDRSWVWIWAQGQARTFDLPHRVTSIALHTDGRQMAVAGESVDVHIMDTRTGAALRTLADGHRMAVQGVTYSRDGRQIATAGQDGTVAVWKADGPGQPWRTHTVTAGNLLAAAFSPDGRRQPAVGHDRLAVLWDLHADRARTLLTPVTGTALQSAAFSPDGSLLVIAGDELRISLWSVPGQGLLLPLTGHRALVQGVGFTDHGRSPVTAAEDGTTALWDLARAMLPDAAGQQHQSVTFDRGGRSVVASAGTAPRMWNTATRGYEGALTGHTAEVYRTAAGATGDLLATASYDGTVRLWNLEPDRAREHACTRAMPQGTQEWNNYAPHIPPPTKCL
ncbi:WD40 repeat domain-containing protein [Spirillospora sp. CA-255316]